MECLKCEEIKKLETGFYRKIVCDLIKSKGFDYKCSLRFDAKCDSCGKTQQFAWNWDLRAEKVREAIQSKGTPK